jgi:hypothetical protein
MQQPHASYCYYPKYDTIFNMQQAKQIGHL